MPSNALDYITVRGFKSISSIEELPLKPINILIGSNGSGKSNFIGVFALLHAVREGHLREYVTEAGGAEKVLHFGSKVTREIVIELRSTNGNYQLKLRPTAEDSLYEHEERISRGNSNGGDRLVTNDEEEAEWDKKRKANLNELLDWRIYHFHDTSSSSLIRKTAKVDDNRFLRADGANLAAFLYYLRERHENAYGLIRGTIQRVAPFFDDFRLEPARLNPSDIKLEWRHKKNSDQYYGASSLSDGSLRFIALATLFLQPEADLPPLILVDEPELGLHPSAIGMLASLIRRTSKTRQVIVSTQSSLLLDHFDPVDVLVTNRVAGSTVITRLEPEPLAEWLKDYSLGQLWEKNEFAGRPAPD